MHIVLRLWPQMHQKEQRKLPDTKQPSAVRWLSLSRTAEGIQSNWPALVMEMEEGAATKRNLITEVLLKRIKTESFVAITHFLLDQQNEYTSYHMQTQFTFIATTYCTNRLLYILFLLASIYALLLSHFPFACGLQYTTHQLSVTSRSLASSSFWNKLICSKLFNNCLSLSEQTSQHMLSTVVLACCGLCFLY